MTMPFRRTDDPLADFHRHEAEKEAWEKKRPKCAECGEHIQQEKAVCIQGYFFCDDCLADLRRIIGDE